MGTHVCVCVSVCKYENQVKHLGNVDQQRAQPCLAPKFSDSEGKVSPLVNVFCVALFQGTLFPSLCARVWKGFGGVGGLNVLVGGFCVYACFVCVCACVQKGVGGAEGRHDT